MTKSLHKKIPVINDDIGVTTGKCNVAALATFIGTIIMFAVTVVAAAGGL